MLASLVVYLPAEPRSTPARWRSLLRPGGILAFTWVIAEDPRFEPVTTRYESPEHCWESSWTRAPALAWSHIPVGRRDQARGVAFKALEGLRDRDGSISRIRMVCYTLGRQAPSGAGG